VKYQILKDTPTIKAGTIGELVHATHNGNPIGSLYYFVETSFIREIVESSPEWFKKVKVRWRARKKESYFVFHGDGDGFSELEQENIFPERNFDFGNYFRTAQQAEEATRRVKECLMKYHEELGE